MGRRRHTALTEQIDGKQAQPLSLLRSLSVFAFIIKCPRKYTGRLMARLREEQIVCRIYALRVIMVSAHLPSDKGPISFCVPWLQSGAVCGQKWLESEKFQRLDVFASATRGRARSIRVCSRTPAAICLPQLSLTRTLLHLAGCDWREKNKWTRHRICLQYYVSHSTLKNAVKKNNNTHKKKLTHSCFLSGSNVSHCS